MCAFTGRQAAYIQTLARFTVPAVLTWELQHACLADQADKLPVAGDSTEDAPLVGMGAADCLQHLHSCHCQAAAAVKDLAVLVISAALERLGRHRQLQGLDGKLHAAGQSQAGPELLKGDATKATGGAHCARMQQ